MPERFDSYHTWLGIPAKDQPPDHYRLLALTRFESDAEAIAAAADQRMGHLRTLQAGPHAADAQRLLGEVARARVTLLDPRRKANYDAMLRSAAPADAMAETVALARPATVPGSAGAQAFSPLTAGQTFGPFRLAECIRPTRQTTVFRVEDPQTGYSYSLKVLNPEAAADPTLRRRFQRETELTTQIRHPNLICGYEGGELNGVPYLVTEYVVGSDLHSLVSLHGRLPVEHSVEFAIQAAAGLAELHRLKVWHRNVSPKNLLLGVQGQIKVTNLLLARIEQGSDLGRPGEELTRMGETMGTVEYLAPEQALDASSVDHRADIYSLGCSLYFLLTGQAVYPGRTPMEKMLAHHKKPVPSLRAACPEAPEWLDAVFQKMIAKRPEDRYQSMEEVAAALEAGTGKPSGPAAWKDAFLAAMRTKTGLACAAAVALLGVAIAWALVAARSP